MVSGFKQREGRFRLDIRRKFIIVMVVRDWHRLLRNVMEASSLEVLKARMGGALSNQI